MENKSDCPVPAGILVIIGGKESKGQQEAPDRKTPAGFVTSDILRRFAEPCNRTSLPAEYLHTVISIQTITIAFIFRQAV